MAPRLKCFARAELASAGQTNAGIGALECFFWQSSFRKGLQRRCHYRLPNRLETKTHAGRPSKAAPQNPAIGRFKPRATA
jgi:hypothetical protein